jgi:murein DD-endopeptidase MepM/ murein hydrolase activator NlpD
MRAPSLAPALTALALVTALAIGLTTASPASADHQPLPRNRELMPYVVQPGDTATGLAVRFHAWTAELVSHNHLGQSGALRVGQRIEIPVVGERKDTTDHPPHQAEPDASRERVRAVIARVSRRRGVDPQLALAVSWQEAGWQMHHVSSAGAIGAMQVLPSTGRWMEWYADRDLRLRKLRDNATAGVLLLDVLADHTDTRRHQVGAYYQGLGAVQRHGLYEETVPYVNNVLAIKRRLEQGHSPY